MKRPSRESKRIQSLGTVSLVSFVHFRLYIHHNQGVEALQLTLEKMRVVVMMLGRARRRGGRERCPTHVIDVTGDVVRVLGVRVGTDDDDEDDCVR